MLSDSDIRDRLGPILDPAPDQDPSTSKRPRALLAALVVVVVLLWAAGAALLFHFNKTRPHAPDRASGRIYRVSDTRHTLYLTAKERDAAWAAVAVPLLATLVLVAAALRHPKPDPVEP